MNHHINFIVHSFDKIHRGGVLRVISILANKFISIGMNVSIYSLSSISNPAFKLNNNIKIISLNLPIYETRNLSSNIDKIVWIFSSYLKLKPYFKNKKNEIWITSSPLLSIIFSFFKKSDNIIIGCDHTSTYYLNSKPFSWFRNKLIKRLDINIALTPEDKIYYQANRINCQVIPNPIEKFYPIPKVNNTILYIGRFSEEKQPIDALKIFDKSNLWKQGFRFKMYGAGNLKNQLLNYIQENKLSNFVEIIENENCIETMFKNARCLLVTSKVEGFPLNVLESFSFGVPCFAYDAPYGLKNQIKNNINGYLIQQGDIDKFVDILKKIDDFPVSSSIQNSIDYLTIDKITIKWINLFSELTSQKNN